MPPWAIRKKQKTEEEKRVITKVFIYKELSFSLLNTFFNNFTRLLFKFDRATDDEVIFNKDSGIVSLIKNQSLFREIIIPSENSTTKNVRIVKTELRFRPLGWNRFFLVFNSTAFIKSDEGMAPGFNNLFFIYYLSTNTTALFSLVSQNTPFAEAAPQITFINGSLLIGGTIDDFIVIGAHRVPNKVITAPFQNKANPGEIGKWHCLSVHWYNPSNSSVWCNGKKLTNFTTRSFPPRPNYPYSDPFTIGAQRKFRDGSNPLDEPMDINIFSGAIGLCSFNRKEMTKNEIKLHHHIFCKYWYDIDHDPIIFD